MLTDARLEIYIGPMFAGKTSKLLEIYHSLQASGITDILVINHSFDIERYKSTTQLFTHDKKSINCIYCNNLSNDIFLLQANLYQKARAILINESNFFDDLVPAVLQMIQKDNKAVYLAGLDGSFKQEPIGHTLDLIPYADHVMKLRADCRLCNSPNKAIFSKRISKEQSNVVVGSDNYVAACRECFTLNKSPIRVKFYSSFCTSKGCAETFILLHPNYDPESSRVKFTDDVNDATHIVILNTAQPRIPAHIPKENVLGLAFEPTQYLGLTDEFVEYATKNIGKYYIGKNLNSQLPPVFIPHYSYMWHTSPLSSKDVIPTSKKPKCMSIMVSKKKHAPGHKYRHLLVSKILESNLPIDIYGKGCDIYKDKFPLDPRIRGEFNDKEPYLDYRFHIAIENYVSGYYVSEKIVNCFVCNTIPVYYGSEQISDLFTDKTVISLQGDPIQDMELLNILCKMPVEDVVNGIVGSGITNKWIETNLSLINHLDQIF